MAAKKSQVSNAQFYAICNELQNKREQIIKECKSRLQVATWMVQKLGITPSDHCVKNALETVGVELERQPRGDCAKKGRNNARVIATALYRLYKKLGEEVPADLLATVSRLNPSAVSLGHAAKPVPVSMVPDPKTIPLVK